MFHIEQVIFQFANEDELPIIICLLKDNHLPYEDLTHRSLQNFLLAKLGTLIKSTTQYRLIFPDSAICMKKKL
ncbi:hypothetical protein EHQ43_02755 [Leptospira bouyouniensis]|uniref:Uncharacterized protein n=1 Tax=Leptospira bouyouniensis TaxID=2484911 RepID=A0A7I0HUR6_9LEPT|nr:hypothetical protein [Leptospira bouyouniensis]TGL07986.1 hypothetical protein EHQ43_02755 [Leptospira bouyouniensis]